MTATHPAPSSIDVLGTIEKIPADPAEGISRPVFAAGAVLWRRTSTGSVEYACIHRPHHDDWSLAKGKVDPGESFPATAAREILEETGFHVRLTKLLPKVTYPMGGKTKVVYYWLAEVVGGEFTANNEVDTIVWLGLNDAVQRLSYTLDRTTVKAADAIIQRGETSRIVLLRRVAKQTLKTQQAAEVARMVRPFHPLSVSSIDDHVCVSTATPLAQWLGVEVASSTTDFAAYVYSLARRGGTHVVVARAKSIRKLLLQLCPTLDDVDALEVDKGSCWLVGFHGDEVVGLDYLASATAIIAPK